MMALAAALFLAVLLQIERKAISNWISEAIAEGIRRSRGNRDE